MSDSLPTVWPADQHTLAKHRILKGYLDAWMPILANQSRKVGAVSHSIKYIDGFAGPGIYENGQKGSPVLALDAARDHSQQFHVPVEFIFIENDRARWEVLKGEIKPYQAQPRNTIIRDPILDDCESALNRMLDEHDRSKRPFGPALVFLDQFGYSCVSMSLLKRIMSNPQCEVLTFLFWRDLNRFITDPNKVEAIRRAFGGDAWMPATELSGDKRTKLMHEIYLRSLREQGQARYVWPFSMCDSAGQLLYWLFFCSNNLHGLREMKRAMLKVDETGTFTFSDRDGLGQMALCRSIDNKELGDRISRHFAGRTVTVDEIEEYVLTETPCVNFKKPLGALERAGVGRAISPPAGRRPYTYPEGSLRLQFEDRLL
jgi:three-Cys-motif partner protein